VYGYCMFKNGAEARVGYPTEGFEGDVAGRSFHNGRFVQRLRQAAAGAPGVALRQGTVRRLLSGAALGRAGGSGLASSCCGCASVCCRNGQEPQWGNLKEVEKLIAARAPGGREWCEGEVVTGVAYRTPDGQERAAAADLTVACDGMYSSLRAKLTVPQARRAGAGQRDKQCPHVLRRRAR
jgi:squalene monooxygenase